MLGRSGFLGVGEYRREKSIVYDLVDPKYIYDASAKCPRGCSANTTGVRGCGYCCDCCDFLRFRIILFFCLNYEQKSELHSLGNSCLDKLSIAGR